MGLDGCYFDARDGMDGAVLLPGDLAKAGEAHLLANVPQQLSATVLIAPHHGSAGSSTAAFAAAVHPQWVICQEKF